MKKISLVFAGLLIAAMLSSPVLAQINPVVNDVHSALNETTVHSIHYPELTAEVIALIKQAKRGHLAVSICAGRHAMGGQQFGAGTFLIDMSRMNEILAFDRRRGMIEVEAGIQWPELVGYLLKAQEGDRHQWGIIQKQTGTSRLSIGGALSANAHGRALTCKPIIDQVESFLLIDADGKMKRCSRRHNPELFRLVIGGYGLFGVITQIQLRLGTRMRVRRDVEIISINNLVEKFQERIKAGYLYGDFQYSTDKISENFMREGIFPTYAPVDHATPLTANPLKQTDSD